LTESTTKEHIKGRAGGGLFIVLEEEGLVKLDALGQRKLLAVVDRAVVVVVVVG
jgi:hypothetical protein